MSFTALKSVPIRNSSVPHFSHILPWTEYREIRTISPYSVRMRENAEKMRTRITPNTDTFCAVFSIKILANITKDILQNKII